MTSLYMNLATIISIAAQIYQYMMIAYVILSYLPSARNSVAGEWLARIVEPYFAPFRRIIPPIGGVLDISPILAFFAFNYAVEGLLYVVRLLFA